MGTRSSSLLGLLLVPPLLSGCEEHRSDVVLHVVDEAGAPVEGATVTTPDEVRTTNASGQAHLRALDHPVLAVVSGAGFLEEPVPLGRQAAEAPVEITLLDAAGRTAIHSTGDVMMGRRYLSPTQGAPLIDPHDDGSSARALVSDVAPALSAADLVTINLETVVGELDDGEAYPGKRWLLQTPPEALAALDPLAVGLVVLANNHQRDWLGPGVQSTLDHLDQDGIPRVGGGLSADEAAQGTVVQAGDLQVGVLAYTSVDGDYVNDQYPQDDETAPTDLAPEDAFKWESRSWGDAALGVPVADRRIGGAWQAIVAAESGLDEAGQASLWASAEAVYPELQDWVARRGHGGANPWSTPQAQAAITALAARTDLVIVQLHMGFQFADAPSSGVEDAARAAIDAGADLVVCHHPHVLQGLEWYDGHLIAYSLGNFLFDQDFLTTFRSAFLRTVWEGHTLVQARLVPLMLDAYRPVPVVDDLATSTWRSLWEGSLLQASAARGPDLSVYTTARDTPRDAPRFIAEHGTARLVEGLPEAETRSITLSAGGIAALPTGGLVDRRLSEAPPAGVLVGRSLCRYGNFEDDDADTDVGEAAGWTWDSQDVEIDRHAALDGVATLRLHRDALNQSRVSARMTARIPMPAHRLVAPDTLAPLDGDASYSLRLLLDRSGAATTVHLRLALYHFDDLDPTEDPTSTLVREQDLAVVPDRGLRTLLLALPEEALAPADGLSPNAALLTISVDPPDHDSTEIHVDDVDLIEWRPADQEPEGWAAIDWLRDSGDSSRGSGEVPYRFLPL